MEEETSGGAAAYCRHGQDKVRCCAKTGAQDAEASCREVEVGDVKRVVRDIIDIEDRGKKRLDYVVGGVGEWAVPCLPRRVGAVVGKVVHNIGRKEVWDFLK